MAGVVVCGHGVSTIAVHGDEARKKCSTARSLSPRNRFLNRRNTLLASISIVPLILQARPAPALIEADDDEELLEKAKGVKQKRIQQRESLNAIKDETEYLQNAVYQMSRAGQAIEKQDFAQASSILGAEWVAKTKSAFAKVSKNTEQKGQAELFTSSLTSLQSAVSKKDAASAKSAFVASASALEKWTSLTGLTSQLKGL